MVAGWMGSRERLSNGGNKWHRQGDLLQNLWVMCWELVLGSGGGSGRVDRCYSLEVKGRSVGEINAERRVLDQVESGSSCWRRRFEERPSVYQGK